MSNNKDAHETISRIAKARQEVSTLCAAKDGNDFDVWWELHNELLQLWKECYAGVCLSEFNPNNVSNFLVNRFHITVVPKAGQ